MKLERKPISPRHLAKYLRDLAYMAKDPTTGNLALSDALYSLAEYVLNSSNSNVPPKESLALKLNPNQLALKKLNHEQVLQFISDESRSRDELLELAFARFSIPSGNLKKLKTLDIKAKIKAASLHEQSINIISREARKDGSRRST